MDIESLLEKVEQAPENGALVATLLVRTSQLDLEKLPEEQQERLYNLLAYVFANMQSGPHNALQTALQKALTQPPVLEFFWRKMEQSAGFGDMLEKNAAAPVILALLCSHDDNEIARRAAIALAFTRSEGAFEMLKRWQADGMNKRLVRAAEVALPYFMDYAG
jgi:hypothetical protein